MKRRWITLALAIGLTFVLYPQLCNLLFDCGCTWWFGKGTESCAIHSSSPSGCPLCRASPLSQLGYGALLALSLFLIASSLPLPGKQRHARPALKSPTSFCNRTRETR